MTYNKNFYPLSLVGRFSVKYNDKAGGANPRGIDCKKIKKQNEYIFHDSDNKNIHIV